MGYSGAALTPQRLVSENECATLRGKMIGKLNEP